MENYYRYIIIATISISVLYVVYQLVLKRENSFRTARFYLLGCMVFSLLLPFNQFSIQFEENIEAEQKIEKEANYKNQTPTSINNDLRSENILLKTENSTFLSITELKPVFLTIYLTGCLVLFLRILFSIATIAYYYLKYEKKKYLGYHIIFIEKKTVPFTFLNMIFLSKSDANKDINEILEHEKTHAKQYHTIDILLTELLVAAMWFNPFIWMYKRALIQVHEFLADEGALKSGVDQLVYQSLLVNQAAEERLVPLSSNFSYSLIKKRIIMMSKKKTHGQIGRKLMMMLPVVVGLMFGVSCVNGQEVGSNDLIAAVSPTKMNVLYIGVDNPVDIAVSGVDKNNIEVAIDNGTITGKHGKYIVRVKKMGNATITVKENGKIISEHGFKVKHIPDPLVSVGGKREGSVTKEELLNAKEVKALIKNFDFDLNFEIIEFTVSVVLEGGNILEAKQTNGNTLTEQQIEIIRKVKPLNKVLFESIKAKGQDGTIRNLRPVVFKIR